MSKWNWIAAIALAMACLAAFSSPCHADLVISIDGAEELFTSQLNSAEVGQAVDDLVELRMLGLSQFKLFGNSVTELWVSDNGNLNSSGYADFYPQPIDGVTPSANVIAPLWDDYLMVKLGADYDPNNRVLESAVSEEYYSVTWQNIRLFNETVSEDGFPDTTRTVQATLFGAETTIRGFDFLPSDVTFSYLSYDGTSNAFVDEAIEMDLAPGQSQLNATIGLASADGNSVKVFSDTNNLDYFQADAAAATLPWTDRQFVLLRPTVNSDGDFVSYDVSIQQFPASVPEPETWMLASICIIGLVLVRAKRCIGWH